MKKLIALLLALMLSFSLVACAQDSNSADTPDNESNNIATEEETNTEQCRKIYTHKNYYRILSP